MTHEQFVKEVTKMRDEATKKVNKLKDADTDDEFSELNYNHGQQVALDQVLSFIQKLTPTK
jgi:hypothetical protein